MCHRQGHRDGGKLTMSIPTAANHGQLSKKFYIADVFTPAQRDRSLMQWLFMFCA
jgi:hypothetical protein